MLQRLVHVLFLLLLFIDDQKLPISYDMQKQKYNLSLGESNPGLPRIFILLGIDKRKS